MNTLIRRTARLREAGPQGIGRGNRLIRRGRTVASFGPALHLAARNYVLADGVAVNGIIEPYTGVAFGNGTGAAQPTFQTNEVNGLPIFRFDGSDDALLSDDTILGSTLFGANTATIYLVYKPYGDDADGNLRPFDWASGAGNEVGLWGAFADNALYFDFGNAGAGGRVSGAQPSGWDDAYHVVEVWRSGANAEITVDGALIVAGTMADDLDGSVEGGVAIGASVLSGSAAKMDFGEAVVINRALSAGERAAMRSLLGSLYGLAV